MPYLDLLSCFFSAAAFNSLLRLRIIRSASVILRDDNGPRFLPGIMSASVWLGLMNGFVVSCGTDGSAVDTLTSFPSKMSRRLSRVMSSPAGCIGSSSSG